MSRPFFYCSELSREAAEKLSGTASTGEVWVLLEYNAPWGPRVLEDSALPIQIKRHLVKTLRGIPHARLLFIKQERTTGELFTLFVVRSSERGPLISKFKLESFEQLMMLDVAAAAAGRPAGGVVTHEPLFLICTHGRRDKCCAKFGYALYKSLRAEWGDSVWQSSHVGGDRFAANLVCFPHGLFYGHVTEAAGQLIVKEYAEGRLVLDQYRGRACYNHTVQSAEFFIRQQSGLSGLDQLYFLRRERISEHSWRVQFYAPNTHSIHEAQVTGQHSKFQNYITCHATEQQSVMQYVLDDYTVTRAPDA